jgi:hypothetical protein
MEERAMEMEQRLKYASRKLEDYESIGGEFRELVHDLHTPRFSHHSTTSHVIVIVIIVIIVMYSVFSPQIDEFTQLQQEIEEKVWALNEIRKG